MDSEGDSVECRRTPDEWQAIERTDGFFHRGAVVFARWFPNSQLSREEYLEGVKRFSGIQFSGRA